MSDAFWDYFFKMLTPVLVAIVAGWFGRRLNVQDKKLDTIETLSNSTLSHMTAKKEEADKKLEANLLTQLAAEKEKRVAAEEKLALLMPPPKKDV